MNCPKFLQEEKQNTQLAVGFTLLELLIVMAILGVLAVIVFVAINPAERQAQSRDTGRISTVAQLGRALQGYYTSNGDFPAVDNWAQDLIDEGTISTFPSGITYASVNHCTSYQQPFTNPTYCYNTDPDNGSIVFARGEAQSHIDKCTSPEVPYFIFSTEDGRGGTICSNGDPTPWAAGSQTYVD